MKNSKRITRSVAAIAAASLLFTGLAATSASAVVGMEQADAVRTVSANGSSITLTAKNAVTGRNNPGLWQDVLSVSINAPAPYTYRSSYGSFRVVDTDWVVTFKTTGSPSCSQVAPTTRSGRGNDVITKEATIFSDTWNGKCDVEATVVFSRYSEEAPGANYNQTLTAKVPVLIQSKGKLTTPKVSKTSVKKGDRVTVSGRFTTQIGYSEVYDWHSVPALNVEIQAKIGSKWQKVATAKTNSKGNYSASIKPTASTAYRAVYVGAKDRIILTTVSGASKSVAVSSKAPAKVSIKTSKSKVSKKAYVSLSGKAQVKPGSKYGAYKKAAVKIQKKSGKKWVTVKTVRTNSKGVWSYKVKPGKTTTYRATVVAAKNAHSATSKTVKVTVKK